MAAGSEVKELSGGGTLVVSDADEKDTTALTIDSLKGALGELQLGKGTTTISALDSAGGSLTKLSLAADSVLDVSALTAINLGTVTVTATEGATIKVGNGTTLTELTLNASSLSGVNDKLTIDLSAFKNNLDVFAGEGLQLFGGDSKDWVGKVTLTGYEDGDRHVLHLTEEGKLVYTTLEGQDLTWNGATDTWEAGGSDHDWNIALDGLSATTNFGANDDVVFDSTGSSKSTVKLSGSITAGDMTVSADGYTFTTNSSSGDKLSVTNLTLGVTGGGAKGTTFEVGTTVTGALTGAGNMSLKSSMSVTGELTNDYSGRLVDREGNGGCEGW